MKRLQPAFGHPNKRSPTVVTSIKFDERKYSLRMMEGNNHYCRPVMLLLLHFCLKQVNTVKM